jgi:opacity protein-like surface antigen
MKRALALSLAILGPVFSANTLAAGPSIIASIYASDVDIEDVSASPQTLLLDIRQPVGRVFWLGAQTTAALSDDELVSGLDVEVGNSLMFNLGAQTEFNHYIAGYAYLGYGVAKVEGSDGDSIDGNGIGWGLGLIFRMADHLVADAGYSTLFDGDMEDSAGDDLSTTIAGPHVGIGFQF